MIVLIGLHVVCDTEHIFSTWPEETVAILKKYAVSSKLQQEIQAVLLQGNVLDCLSAIYCGTGYLRICAKRKLHSLGFIFYKKDYVFSIKSIPGYIFKMACFATDGKNYRTEFQNISRVIRAAKLRKLPGLIVPRKWFYIIPKSLCIDYENLPKVIVVAEQIDLKGLEPYTRGITTISSKAQESLTQVYDVHGNNVFITSTGDAVVIDTEVHGPSLEPVMKTLHLCEIAKHIYANGLIDYSKD